MARLNPAGRRLVSKQVRYPVPQRLLANLDTQAAEVIRQRRDTAFHDDQARHLGHAAFRAADAADRARDSGLRQMLHSQAERLRLQAASARSRAARAKAVLGRSESALSALHGEARRYQSGELGQEE